jgi:hypothetical protein
LTVDSHEILSWATSTVDLSTGPSKLGLCSYLVRLTYSLSRTFIYTGWVGPQTFLFSRANGLVTVYDVSREDDGLMYSNVPPYSLPPISGYETRITGHSFFQHPPNSSNTTTIYQMNDRGSIHCLDLYFPPANQTKRDQKLYEWSADVQSLAETADVRPDMGPLASQVASEVNLRPAYRSKTIGQPITCLWFE